MSTRTKILLATTIILLLILVVFRSTPTVAQNPATPPNKGPEPTPHLTETAPSILQIDPTLLRKIEPQLLKRLLTSAEQPVPFIVYLNTQADIEAAAASSVAGLSTGSEPAELVKRRAIVNALQQTARNSQTGVLQALGGGVTGQSAAATQIKPLWIVNAVAARGSLSTVLDLAARADVEIVRLDKEVRIKPVTYRTELPAEQAPGEIVPPFSPHSNNPFIGVRQLPDLAAPEWNIAKIRADLVHNALGIDGSGVVVANIDSGVDWFHPALQARYRGYTGAGKPATHPGNWYDATGGGALYPVDSDGHGTHTMGTMVGANGVGVAPGAQWIAVRAFDSSGSALNSWLHEAFQWILAPDGDPALAPDLVNNSWGSDDGSITEFEADIQALSQAGIFPIFSAGNNGPAGGTIGSPGSLRHAFSVGATDINDDITIFSSRGPSPWGEIKPEISAPGKDIRSTLPGGAYGNLSGTSMAAPHVSGLTALLLQASPSLEGDLAALAQAITSTAVYSGATIPTNDYGWGRIDAYGAVMSAASSGVLEGVVTGNGTPLTNAVIQITPRNGGAVIFTVSDGNGAYLQGLTGGTYDVTASAFGFQPKTQFGVTIQPNSTATQNFSLSPQPTGTLVGTVKDKNNPAISLEAAVTIDGTPVSAASDPNNNGSYSLNLPIGVYTVTVTAKEHRIAKSVGVVINDGATVTRDFLLDSAPSILLVDSGRWYQESQIEYYRQALLDALYPFDTRQIIDPELDIPSAETLAAYDVVIWSAPLDSPGYISADDKIEEFLDGGGKLLLSGQNIGYFDGGGFLSPEPYFSEYLKAVYVQDTAEGNLVTGVAGEPFAGLGLTLNGGDGADNQNSPDVIANADVDFARSLLAYEDERLAGLHVSLCVPYRVIYLSFGIEGLDNRSDRSQVIAQAIDWLMQPPPPLAMELTPERETVVGSAGSVVSHTVRLRNTGSSSDRYDLSFSAGSPSNWTHTGAPSTIALNSCEAQEIMVDVTIPLNAAWHISDTFTIAAQSIANSTVRSVVTRATKTPAPVLLVDDDRWYSFADDYKAALDANNIDYDYWRVPKSWIGPVPPSPSLKTLQMYPMTVWYTAYDWFQPLTPTEEARLAAYLDSGGRLFFSSQDFLYRHRIQNEGEYAAFAQDYLGVQAHTEDFTSTLTIGQPDNPVGAHLGPYPLTFPIGYRNWTDALSPTVTAQATTRGQASQINGLMNTGFGNSGRPWHTNFLAYGPELLTPAERTRLLQRSLGWLSWLGQSSVTPSATASLDGAVITYTVVLANNGWSDLSAAYFTATFPAELTPGPASPGLTLSNGNYVWSGPLAQNSSNVFTYTAALADSLPIGTLVSQTSWLAYPEHNIRFDRAADVKVNFPNLTNSAITVTPTQDVKAGDVLSYTITLRNDGLVDNPGVTATNTLPHMLEFVSIDSPSKGNLQSSGRSLTWTTALAKDEEATLTYRTVISYRSSGAIRNVVYLDDDIDAPIRLSALTTFEVFPKYFPVIFKN